MTQTPQLSKGELEAIAAFRYAIRQFLRTSEENAYQCGITPQQHHLLLAIKGTPHGRAVSVSELADRLQTEKHSMVGLINRTETQGLVRREQGEDDRRQVFVHITPAGAEKLRMLSVQHRRELLTMHNALRMPNAPV